MAKKEKEQETTKQKKEKEFIYFLIGLGAKVWKEQERIYIEYIPLVLHRGSLCQSDNITKQLFPEQVFPENWGYRELEIGLNAIHKVYVPIQ